VEERLWQSFANREQAARVLQERLPDVRTQTVKQMQAIIASIPGSRAQLEGILEQS
jgi:hypothetical protein